VSKAETLHDFDKSVNTSSDHNSRLLKIEQANNAVIELAEGLNDGQVSRLLAALHTAGKMKPVDTGEDEEFDAAAEVSMLLKTVKALREHVILNGEIKHGVSINEAHKVVTACGSMINTLMKHEEQLQSMERQRAVEGAVIDTLKYLEETFPDVKGVVDTYMSNLETRLKDIK
jgi:hypothetical protein